MRRRVRIRSARLLSRRESNGGRRGFRKTSEKPFGLLRGFSVYRAAAGEVFHARRACTDEKPNHGKAELWQSQTAAKSNQRKTIRSDIYNGGTPGKAAADPGVLLFLGVEALEVLLGSEVLKVLLSGIRLKYYLSAKRLTQSSISSGMKYLSGSKRTVLERSSDSGAGGVTPVRRAVSSMHSNSSSSFLPVSAG